MIKLYANLIEKGIKTIEEVPETLREQVQTELEKRKATERVD